MRKTTPGDTSIHAAALSAAALIAHQVGGKATRDALFLSQFDVTALPWIVVVASILSIVLGVAGARLMASMTPGRLVPRAFLASAALLLLGWGVSYVSPAIAAVLVYLQIAALGSSLISGFWTLLADRYDPHTARTQFTRVVGAGTVGGMIGGLLAERVGTTLGVGFMLPVLAALDLICALLTSALGRGSVAAVYDRRSLRPNYSAFRTLWAEPYLRHLASLLVFTTVGAGLLDYVFKARAVAVHHGGGELVRFFAVFYTAIGVLTFLVQIALSRFSLERFGLSATIGSLPFAVAIGSVAGIVIPGLGSAGVVRGSEAVLRSSLFRSGYELFFAAVPARKRRQTKPILDIGFERVGDMLGGILISILLLLGSIRAIPFMLAVAVVMGLVGLWISRRLHRGYVKALEANLLNQSIHIEISDIRDSTTRAAVMRTLGPGSRTLESRQRTETLVVEKEKPKTVDPLVQRVMDLCSSDVEVVRRALRAPLDAVLAAHTIRLLAWNAVADDAVQALQRIAPSITGLLVDALLDPDQEFAVRRRIPRVLAVADSKRAFDGLTQGLFDNRFEVRFQSGRALAQIQDRSPDILIDHSMITEAVLHELLVDKEVWESRRVIDAGENEPASVGSEHVFRLLSLILPREPMRIAYRGLHSGDKHLKGMAMEYFETVLPADVLKTIRPLLETA
jgi:AAA family ATP:ADP antiporter